MPLPQLQFHVVNAFAPTPHAGNQAAVVIIPADDPRGQDDKYMQTIAADFNLSETAFLVPIEPDAEAPKYSLRWFTPGEVCDKLTLTDFSGGTPLRPRNARFGIHPLQLRTQGREGATLPNSLARRTWRDYGDRTRTGISDWSELADCQQ